MRNKGEKRKVSLANNIVTGQELSVLQNQHLRSLKNEVMLFTMLSLQQGGPTSLENQHLDMLTLLVAN